MSNSTVEKSEGLLEYEQRLSPRIIADMDLYCYAGTEYNTCKILGFNEFGTVVEFDGGYKKLWQNGYVEYFKLSTNKDTHVKMTEDELFVYKCMIDEYMKLKKEHELIKKQEEIVQVGKLIKRIRVLHHHIFLNEEIPENLLEEVISACNNCLIDSNALPNYDTLDKLREVCKGVKINLYAKEKDSFGWLIGCLNIDGYEILFG